MAEVVLEVAGVEVVSAITGGSAEALKLQAGDEVKAVISDRSSRREAMTASRFDCDAQPLSPSADRGMAFLRAKDGRFSRMPWSLTTHHRDECPTLRQVSPVGTDR
jgi:hypothetical protein